MNPIRLMYLKAYRCLRPFGLLQTLGNQQWTKRAGLSMWVILAHLVSLTTAQLPKIIELSPVVTKLLEDSVTTKSQKRSLAIFHGQSHRIEDLTVSERAQIALQRYDLTNPILMDNMVNALTRGRAALARGDAQTAILLLRDEPSAQAAIVKATALEDLGHVRDSIAVLKPWRDLLISESLTLASELTAATSASVMLARLEGRPAQAYMLAMSLFGKIHSELDPLYWPAFVAEAMLLVEKDNGSDAGTALIEALQLNPSCSIAWYQLGLLALKGYDFETADRCCKELHKINDKHLLADLLRTEILLTQKDAIAAEQVIKVALERYPKHLRLLSLLAATQAMMFDPEAMRTTLDHIEQQSPLNPIPFYTIGRYLSIGRQYTASDEMLREAIKRASNWPAPRIELGLMLMQRGDETQALLELRHAVRLDPFNRQADNQLKLAQELQAYEQIKTEHFVIKYRAGIDEVLARDMPDTLEQIYEHLTNVFGYRPSSATLIEILPDEKRFAVRITGMPDIWTIAACTGDVIAMTPPRAGAGLGGSFDWERVVGHEFVHTITLNQTHFRIPHWFTEGCAVSQEPGGRLYAECILLATAYAKNQLFDLHDINWAFVRPKEPQDRPLAYAQSSWMVQFITEQFGFQAIIKMLEEFRHGATNSQAIQIATGLDDLQLMTNFHTWAGNQISNWGLETRSEDEAIDPRKWISANIDSAEIDRLMVEYPDHPDLLKLVAQRATQDDDPHRARQAVLTYAAARPVDPWSDEQMVKLAIQTNRPNEAIAALEQLDRQETKTGKWAHQLTLIHRSNNQLNLAANAIKRALSRQPYHAGYRELAATLYLQAGDLPAALDHLQAIAMIEPDRAIHQVRLAAIYTKMDQPQNATIAASAARKLDPTAQVERYFHPVEPTID